MGVVAGSDLWVNEREAAAELDSLSNWGKWGDKDERGALNYVDLDAIRRGTGCVRNGTVYPLSQMIKEIGAAGLPGRPPSRLFMALDGGDWAAGAGTAGTVSGHGGIPKPGDPSQRFQTADECLLTAFHGTSTHVDGLAHYWTEGKMYNGFSGNLVRSYSGAMRLGVEKMRGLVTRGVLLDVAGHRGVAALDADDYITIDDIVGCSSESGIVIERGDAVLIQTGWPKVFYEDPQKYGYRQPGVGASAALYLAKKEICLLGADNVAVSAMSPRFPKPGEPPTQWDGLYDLHNAYIRNLGIYLLEMLDLSTLANDHVREFLFCLAPLLIKGATGSPVNPLALT